MTITISGGSGGNSEISGSDSGGSSPTVTIGTTYKTEVWVK